MICIIWYCMGFCTQGKFIQQICSEFNCIDLFFIMYCLTTPTSFFLVGRVTFDLYCDKKFMNFTIEKRLSRVDIDVIVFKWECTEEILSCIKVRNDEWVLQWVRRKGVLNVTWAGS